jgi:hypothetical protein
MKTKYLKKVEEKYVFNISLIFWHLLVALAVTSAIGGALMLLWGITPTIKSSVKKDSYPPVAIISFEELQTKVVPTSEKETAKIQTETTKPPKISEDVKKEEPAKLAAGEAEYTALVDSLKALIPPDKYAWTSKGHWEYPYGKAYWDYYKDARYRQWKVDRLGITDLLNSAYRKANANDFIAQKELLGVYISVLVQFPEEKRAAALQALTLYTKEGVAQSVSNVQLLSESVPNFSTDRVDYLEKLASFGERNPNDGRAFIGYANKILNKFDPEIRFDALQTIISKYYSSFNNRLTQQIEMTDLFLPYLSQFEAKYQVKALENYYELSLQKNADRIAAIRQIDYEYEQRLSEAESAHGMNKAKKAGWRKKGLYVIGGAIVSVAVLALILALLSIQRYLEKIYASLQKE